MGTGSCAKNPNRRTVEFEPSHSSTLFILKAKCIILLMLVRRLAVSIFPLV